MRIIIKRKYLPYFIFGGIILVLGSILAWRELRNTPRTNMKTATTTVTKTFKQQTIATNTVRLSNGKSVTVEFQLTDATAIQDLNESGNGPGNQYVYYGQGQIQVSDSDTSGKKKVLDTYYVNSLDYHLPQLNCILNQSLLPYDYNNDKNPDFLIGQSNPTLGYLQYFYSIDSNGKISRLDTNGPVILRFGWSFYNGIILNNPKTYYRWNKTKFERKDISTEIIPISYPKSDVSNLLFHYSHQPTITFNSSKILESKSDISYECKRDFWGNKIEISGYQDKNLALLYTYNLDANSIELQPTKQEEPKLKLSDDQLIELAKKAKEILDYSLNEFSLPELTK
ncbi:hypothetical protein RBG61_05245 [Paludicola sp. MB14-C6]|uniref:hypothetical protein n=1 Tax=Paludihabitans sp. MB14-C6 TaxID=3070656 RepID=UPI0027DDAACB|nr:hypothetical protein [Paludicola sp. MB14-C6]WMJ24076.1 hypothetical protein RBG61_05245 [Paludicola sp. MB14-C6]